jgi:hypothetical protein
MKKSDFVILGEMRAQKNIILIPEKSEYVLGELKNMLIIEE